MELRMGMGQVVEYRRRTLIDVLKWFNEYTRIYVFYGSCIVTIVRVASTALFLLFVQMRHTRLSVSERVYGMPIASRVRASDSLTRSAFPSAQSPLTSQG